MLKISEKLNYLPTKAINEIFELQGNLKDLTEKNYQKLLNRLNKEGFKYPLYVWIDSKGKCWTLDGHQRKRVIEKAFGNIEVPYIEVFAKDKNAAKKEILAISSDYGEVTKDGWDEFIAEFDENDLTEISEDFTFEKWEDVNFEQEPTNEDLIADAKNKPATLKITFESPEQLQKAEIDIQELIDRKYKGAYFSVSAGEL